MKKIIRITSFCVFLSSYACALFLAALSLLRIMATAAVPALRLLAVVLFLLLIILHVKVFIVAVREFISRIRQRKAQ